MQAQMCSLPRFLAPYMPELHTQSHLPTFVSLIVLIRFLLSSHLNITPIQICGEEMGFLAEHRALIACQTESVGRRNIIIDVVFGSC